MSFTQLGLCPEITRALSEIDYSQPTDIQTLAIPEVLAGENLIAAAQTGTGKTAAFVLPLLERFKDLPPIRPKRIRALVLTPTRELALQITKNIELYSRYLPSKCLAMYGGVDSAPQKRALIQGVDILVATPGRLLDMYTQRAVHFDELQVLVLDEADKMLDMGFIEDINQILDRLPKDRQNLLFSATLSKQVRQLVKTAVSAPKEIAISRKQANKANIEQWLVTVDKDKKSALLSHLIKESDWQQALIFIETKQGAAKLVSQLEKRGIVAEAFHSGRSQASREQVLADFTAGKVPFLVATGIAARGIDIVELARVVNYDLPHQADDYIHRIGRTGRAGFSGEAISFVSMDDFKNLCNIERRLEQLIERRVIDGFAPRKVVPVSVLNFVPKHPQERKPRVHKDKPSLSDSSVNPRGQKISKGGSRHQATTTAKTERSKRPETPSRRQAGSSVDPWQAAADKFSKE
ncbi:DEAD/DEAH box helicase [Shewanella sp. NIFS-20-20]|uniref:DEAD/DEAH box helicase n=1 Tax=Shewanella sp. NIFS-20-20 TaxID=2853806 RepID=UPI001C47E553|nr:DEAD/DEAH box helicase [Shewanella sp. NIFS-20-20]MBV7314407.1 DEAD/DEAH box helicase [Shewanella sp. NIFS-20-20]